MIEIVDMLRLWLRGLALREVARLSGVDLKTVRRCVDHARACGLDRDGGDDQLSGELIAAVIAAAADRGSLIQSSSVVRKPCSVVLSSSPSWPGRQGIERVVSRQEKGVE